MALTDFIKNLFSTPTAGSTPRVSGLPNQVNFRQGPQTPSLQSGGMSRPLNFNVGQSASMGLGNLGMTSTKQATGRPDLTLPNMSTPQGQVYSPPPNIQSNQSVDFGLTTPMTTAEKTPTFADEDLARSLQGQTNTFIPPAPIQDTKEVKPKLEVPPEIPKTTELEQAVLDAEKAYQESLKLSPDEITTQEDADRLLEATKNAYRKVENQPVALNFITGRLQNIQNQALDLAEPLQRKMARLQSERLAAQGASKFALERAEQKLQEAQKQPEQPEGFTLGEGQARFDAQGNIIAFNPKEASGAGDGADILSVSEAKALGVPYGTTRQQAFGLQPGQTEQTQAQQQQISSLTNKIETIDSILNNPALNNMVGTTVLGRITSPFELGQSQEFAGEVANLISQETIDTLVSLKERGGTLGALSDQERVLLQNAATKLGNWAVKDKNGNLTGKFKVSEDAFKRELNRIKDLAQKAIERAGGTTGGQQFTPEELEYIRSQGVDPSQIGFSQVGGDTNQAVDKIANAIAQVESGGRYNAVGPTTAKGNRAYGKYQVMDFNIPNWTKEALGRSLTPQQFLNSPRAQEAVAQYKFTQLLNKYGNPADVASVWFSGRPVSRAGNSSDVTGTTVPQYVQRVLNNLG